MTPLPANKALDLFFLDARARLLDLAAVLDRLDRGAGASPAANDPRVQKLRQALDVLRSSSSGRAERMQQLFSLDYDPNWPRPVPR